MRTIGLRQFQQNLHKEIKDLPFLVTRKGAPVFKAVQAAESSSLEEKINVVTKMEPQEEPVSLVTTASDKFKKIKKTNETTSGFPYKPKFTEFQGLAFPKKTWTKEKLDKFVSLETPKSTRCQIPNCFKGAIGQFEFNVYSDGTEVKLTKSLCAFHKTKMEREQPM